MELTNAEYRKVGEVALCAYQNANPKGSLTTECGRAAVKSVLESCAASDQGLRKAAQEAITKIESIAPMIYSVVFLSSPAKTPWDILGLLPCAQALKDALARQTQDGLVIGEEQPPYKKCGKVAQTFIAGYGSFFPCALEEGHQGPCLQSGTCFRHGVYFGENCPHWPKCADQLLAPRREPNYPMSGTMQDEVRVTDRAQEPLSQQEVEPFGDNESSRFVAGMKGASARAAGFPKDTQHGYAGRNADRWVDGWEYCDDCLRDPNFKPAPSSVQPSTEDVVAQMVAVAETAGQHHSNPLMILRCQMHAALPVARAGWHSWESVEKAIRAEFVHQFKSSYAHELGGILYGVQRLLSQQDAKAKPAERVTDPAVEAVAMVICTKCGARVGYPELHNKWHNVYAELDAQGGNKA